MYLKSDTLLLTDVFKTFRKTGLEIYGLDPINFLSASVLAWQAALKKTKAKLESLTDIDMLLKVEKWIRGGICLSINRYAKPISKYMKRYDGNKESSYLKYWDVNNLYCWEILQNLPLKGFKGVKDLSEFEEGFIKSY